MIRPKRVLVPKNMQQAISEPIIYNEKKYAKVLVQANLEARGHINNLEEGHAYIIMVPEGDMERVAAWDFGNLLLNISDPREGCIAIITKEDIEKIGRSGWSETDKIRSTTGTYPA